MVTQGKYGGRVGISGSVKYLAPPPDDVALANGAEVLGSLRDRSPGTKRAAGTAVLRELVARRAE